jgi:hypothetical protein
VIDGLWLHLSHDRSHYIVIQSHSHALHVFHSCGILVCGFSQWLTHLVVIAFSHSMNTCELDMRFCLFDGFLDSFFLRVRMSFVDMLLEVLLLVHDFVLVMLLLVLLILFPLEIFIIFLMIASFFSSS